MTKKTLITCALPYANGDLHIGNMLEHIQGDIITRFFRLQKRDVIFIGATDTHGTPIELNARKLGISPEELVVKFHKSHVEDFKKFNISYDNYYTTDSPENKELDEYFFNTFIEKDLIYTKEVELMYSESLKRFLPDRYVKGECPKCGAEDQYGDACEKCHSTYEPKDLIHPYSTIDGSKPILKKSNHYFFKLSSQSDWLKKFIKESNFQPEVKSFVNSWIDQGLKDWGISRDGPYFGFKIPGEENKYFYVWLDAPIGYISSTKNFTKDWESYWKEDSDIIHIIGKDIQYFHFLFWPAMLHNVGFTLPKKIVVHGFVNVGGGKMSKSRGTFYTASDFANLFEPEFLRYYYASKLSLKISDIDLDFRDFQAVINNELVATVGNLCYRVLSFINNKYYGEIKKIANAPVDFSKLFENVAIDYENFNYKAAVKKILEFASAGNRIFQEAEPWKDPENKEDVVGFCANIVRNLAILLKPITPNFSQEVEKQLGDKELFWDDLGFDFKGKIEPAEILIDKIEKIPESKIFPLDLKVGTIKEVNDHPNADSLYVLKVDLGKEERTLVAGLKKHFSKVDLEGRNVVVVSNLKPAKLRGVESQGMILAAEDKQKNVALLSAPGSKPGDSVSFDGLTNNTEQITFDDFSKFELLVKKGKVMWKDNVLKTEKEDVQVIGVGDDARVC